MEPRRSTLIGTESDAAVATVATPRPVERATGRDQSTGTSRAASAIGVVEAAYDLHARDDVWLRAIAEAARPLIDAGLGAWAVLFEQGPEGVRVGDAVCVGAAAGMEDFFRRSSRGMFPGTPRFLGSPITLSSLFGAEHARELSRASGVTDAIGAVDALGLGVTDLEGFGVVVGAPLPRPLLVDRGASRALSRVGAHLHTALRARRRRPEQPFDEAVLTPNGRLLHAENDCRTDGARKRLRAAARAIDRARTSGRHQDSDGALDAWRAMVAGRWTLIDRFESDGRRFIVARPNAPRAQERLGLTRAETTCAFYAAMGHSGKLIAYELGIAESTVSTHLRRALAKLGVASRAELASVLGVFDDARPR